MATRAISRTLVSTLIAAMLLTTAVQAVPAFSGRTPVSYSFFSGPARGQLIRPMSGNVAPGRRLIGAFGLPTASEIFPSIPDGAILVLQAQQTGLDAVLRQDVSIYSSLGSEQLRLGNYVNVRAVTPSVVTPSGLNFVEGKTTGATSSGNAVAVAQGAWAEPVLGSVGLTPATGSIVEMLDALGARSEGSGPATAETVPEPATVGLFGLAALALWRTRRL